jgi:hypothetical protein
MRRADHDARAAPLTGRCGLLLLLLLWPRALHADGAMMQGDRVLLRQGPAARDYCKVAGAECDAVKTKVLSGYGYLRGRVVGGVISEPGDGSLQLAGVAALRVDAVSAALPGASITLGSVDALWRGNGRHRLRLVLLDSEGLFVCRDAQNGRLVAPFIGMTTRHCREDAVLAVDVSLLGLQWDTRTDRLVADWGSLGPSFELLANGHGQAHVLRSVLIGVPFDVRSLYYGDGLRGGETSFGAGVRATVLYRTPHWESRLRLRHRTALIGGRGIAHANQLDAELRLVRNFFLTDAVVAQAGLTFNLTYSQRPLAAASIFAAYNQAWAGFAGVYLGWIGEPPGI